ncbi:insulinase family protein [Candidatus Woesebacteria bacterium]|nr:insulinase family protein [Candidatus Woesebacteria bacterium]
MHKPQVKQLSNGLTLLRIPITGVQSVTALVLVNVGSRFEPLEQAGIAHFFEHIVFKGTNKYPSALELSSTIDAVGAEFNAFTSKEYTGFYVKVASRHFQTALDVLSDMMLQPLIPADDIVREQKVIIEEINMYKDNPMSHVSTIFDHLFFSDTHLSHDIIGTKETVSNIQKSHFEQFLADWYGLHNITLVLAGDATLIADTGIEEQVLQSFSKEPTHPRKEMTPEKQTFFTQDPISTDRIACINKQTEQAHFVVGWPGFKRTTEQRPIISLLSVILGGNMSSRLFTEVREKRGLCYYVHSEVDYYQDTGVIGASAGVDPKRAEEAVRVVIEECRALANGDKPLTEGELVRAKEYIAGTLLLSLEDSKDVAQYFGIKKLLMNETETPEEALAKIQAVTSQQVVALAQQVFMGKPPKLAIIGPFADESVFAQILTELA